MNLNNDLATKILEAMFWEYSMDFIISTPDDDLIYFEIENNNINLPDNNQISLNLKKEQGKIKILCNTRSEDYKLLGIYDIKDDDFFAEKDFWQKMFTAHLQ